ELRAELKQSLRNEGLFDDEAEAMLNTWQRSYFQGVGQRVFFIVPRKWTDRALPLKFSVPVEVTRAMIGRIELITPEQRQTIATLPMNAKGMEKLGRFGYAMVLDELKRRPSRALEIFTKSQGIVPFVPPPAALGAAPTTRPVAIAE